VGKKVSRAARKEQNERTSRRGRAPSSWPGVGARAAPPAHARPGRAAEVEHADGRRAREAAIAAARAERATHGGDGAAAPARGKRHVLLVFVVLVAIAAVLVYLQQRGSAPADDLKPANEPPPAATG
jgi:hypothetical protein